MIADKVKELELENNTLRAQVEELQEICGSRGIYQRTVNTARTLYSIT